MEVRVGPVSAASVTVWVAYAQEVLATPGEHDVLHVDAVALEAFNRYLSEWAMLARVADPFLWVGEVDPERLEYLAHSFARIVEHLAALADHRGLAGAPAEGEEFYQALVASIIGALRSEQGSASTFSEQLRDRWPGLRSG